MSNNHVSSRSHKNHRTSNGAWTASVLSGILLSVYSAHGAIPREQEPEYALASLAFHDKKFQDCAAILTKLIETFGPQQEYLELRALALKLDQKTETALEAYQSLHQFLIQQNGSPSALGAASFEIGMILVSQKKLPEAISYFETAAENKINPGTSSLYVGLGAMESANWNKAESAFKRVQKSTRPELIPPASLYLGQTYVQMGFPAGAIDSFKQADEAAKIIESSTSSPGSVQKMASTVRSSAAAAIQPYDQAKFFANVSLLGGYDSNLLAVPNSIASNPSGKSSNQAIFLGGLGYLSSPVNEIQWVPSYRIFYNNNLDPEAEGTEFLNHSASFALNRNTLGVFSQGVRADGTWTFRNDGALFANYSMRAILTGYLAYFVSPGVKANWEVFYGLQDFHSDPGNPDLARTGDLMGSRLSVRKIRGTQLLNPGLELSYQLENTSGTEYRSQTASIGVSNRIIVSPKVDVIPSVDWAWVTFPDRTQGERADFLTAIQVSTQWRFQSNWTVLLTVGHALNTSNLSDTFSYQRTSMSSGISYSY